jgi:hypothetical protein
MLLLHTDPSGCWCGTLTKRRPSYWLQFSQEMPINNASGDPTRLRIFVIVWGCNGRRMVVQRSNVALVEFEAFLAVTTVRRPEREVRCM